MLYDDAYENAGHGTGGHGIGDLTDLLNGAAAVASVVTDPLGAAVGYVAGQAASTATAPASSGVSDPTGQTVNVDPQTGGTASPSCPPAPNVTSLKLASSDILDGAARLRQLGYQCPDDPTGMTDAYRGAVCLYQTKKGLTVDGEIGAQTLAALRADTGGGASPASPSAPAAATTTTDDGPNWLLIGGVVAAGLAAVLLLKGKRKKKS